MLNYASCLTTCMPPVRVLLCHSGDPLFIPVSQGQINNIIQKKFVSVDLIIKKCDDLNIEYYS